MQQAHGLKVDRICLLVATVGRHLEYLRHRTFYLWFTIGSYFNLNVCFFKGGLAESTFEMNNSVCVCVCVNLCFKEEKQGV